MALQVRRNSSLRVRVIATLMMTFVLVAQPLYGIVSAQIARASSLESTVCASGCDYVTIADAVAGSDAGATINVEPGVYEITSTIVINKSLSLIGKTGAVITTNGDAHVFVTTAPNVTIMGFTFTKTDKTSQNLINIQGANTAVKDNDFSGKYVLGEDEVARALVVSTTTGVEISGNRFTGLRQPAYINDNTQGKINDNFVDGSRGWVLVANTDFTFTGNTWGTNAVDIAFIPGAPNTYSCDKLASIKLANNNAFIDNQALSNPCVVPAVNKTVTGDTSAGENQPGWLFNRDPATTTPFEFTFDKHSTGEGSLFVKPISDSNKDNKFVAENFLNIPVRELKSVSYDYMIAGNGDSADVNQFYTNVYVNISGAPNFYDCRFDYVPTVGSTTEFKTAKFNTVDTPVNVQKRGTRISSCPATLAAMPAGSYVRAISISVGDTSLSDAGLAGYLDKAVVATTSAVTTYDFEAVPRDTSAPTITNLKVVNPSLWGDNYNLLALPNHVSTASGLPTVGGNLNVSADFADNMVLTNIISLLPGRGFFTNDETSPFPTNNGTWSPITQGRYSVAWNTKTGADWRSVPDGNHTFIFEARDGGNGQNRPQNSMSVPIEVTVDNTAPGVGFTGATPAENATVRGDIVVEGTFTDTNGLMNTDIGVHAVNWYCHTDWPTVGAKSCTIDTTKLADGPQQLTMSVRDKAGNTAQVFRSITVDNTSPSVPQSGAPHDTYELDNDFYFTWGAATDNISAPVTYEYQSSLDPAQLNGVLTNGLWRSDVLPEAKIHSTGAPDGMWYWQVRAIDAVGNKSAWSNVWQMTIDHIAPALTLTSPANNAVLNGASLTQSWVTVDTDVNHYEYESYNDSAMTNLRFAQNMGLQTSKTATNVGNATFWWRVKAVDNAGHATWSELRKLTIDNNKPTAQLLFAATGSGATSFKVKFNEAVNKDDAANTNNYFLHNWPGGGTFDGLSGDATAVYDPATMTATISFTNAGWYVSPEQNWGVRNIRDLAGNILDETSDYSTPMTKPTIANIDGTADGKNITWTWTGEDVNSQQAAGATGNSGVKQYQYRLMQGAAVVKDWATTTDTSVTTTVADDGVYTLVVRAEDNAGNSSSEATSDGVLVDTTAPVLTINTPIQNADGTYSVSGTTTDVTRPIVVKLNGTIVDDQIMADTDGAWKVGLGALSAGVTYAVSVDAEDMVGNAAHQQVASFATPAIVAIPLPTLAVLPLVNVNTPTPLPQSRAVAVAVTDGAGQAQGSPAQDAAVLGAQTAKEAAATNVADTSAIISPSGQGWKLFSLAWYWWVLVAFAVAGVWWVIAGVRRRSQV